jgi:alkylresorcinol/alkylpyrone synthase
VRRRAPRIAGLAVCDPPYSYSQEQVLERLGLTGNEFAEGIFERSGVSRRHLELDDEFLDNTLQGRTARVEELLMERTIGALEKLDFDPARIGTVITSSLVSLGCPTLAHRLLEHYRMNAATDKYHLTGVGCASAVPLMRLAGQAMAASPGRQALVVTAESMSALLTRASADEGRAKIVGSAIFGDGCAAALLSGEADAEGPSIVASEVHHIAGTLGVVRVETEPANSYLHLERDLPDLAGAGVPAVVDRFLERQRLSRAAIDHWIVHPGGRRIIENVQSALQLSNRQLETSWRTLAEHGNVGTPSIMYVLADAMAHQEPRAGERGLMVTIGPGVTVGLMLLAW